MGPVREALAAFLRTSRFGGLLILPYRLWFALSYYRAVPGQILRFLLHSHEYTNVTYDLEAKNRSYLAAFVAAVGRVDREAALAAFEELEGDPELRNHIRAAVATSPLGRLADGEARYAGRIAWYALVRLTKPRFVVEIGVDKGLGSCVIAAALRRNRAEGQPGTLLGLDINPRAGFLLNGAYATDASVRLCSANRLELPEEARIDILINDSAAGAENEWSEYRHLERWLAPEALILGRNCHSSDALYRYAGATGRLFLAFMERPRDSWYPPGSTIGACFPPCP